MDIQKIRNFFGKNPKTNVAVLLLVSAIARFAFLGLRPFDGDEGIVIKIASANTIRDVLSGVAKDVHPPLYHLLEHFVLSIFPLNEVSSRALSAVAGILAIYLIYLVFCELSTKKIALVIAYSCVFSSILAYHAAEVRPYSLFTAVFFAQFYYFIVFLKGSKGKKYTNLFLILTSLALILTQYIGFLILLGEGLYLLLDQNSDRKKLKSTLPLFISVVAFFALWGKSFFHQVTGRMAEQSQALSIKENLIGIFNALYRFVSGRLFLDIDPSISKNIASAKDSPALFVVFVLSVIVPLGLFAYGGLYLSGKQNRKTLALILICLGPTILASMLSSEIGPRATRYLSFCAPFYLYFLIVGLGSFYSVRKKYAFFTLAIIALAIYLSAFINGIYFERKAPGVNAIASYLKSNAKSGDYLLIKGGFGGGEGFVERYYLGNFDKKLVIADYYGDYQVGNLDQLADKKITDFFPNIPDGDNSLWMYDLTYSLNFEELINSLGRGHIDKIVLGLDKENKELALYKISQ